MICDAAEADRLLFGDVPRLGEMGDDGSSQDSVADVVTACFWPGHAHILLRSRAAGCRIRLDTRVC